MTLSTSYLQFSKLLRARAFWTSERSPSLVFLVGPWVGSQHETTRFAAVQVGFAYKVG